MEAFIENVSDTVEKESHEAQENVSEAVGNVTESVEKKSREAQENVSEAVGNVTESVEGVADEGKEEAKKKVAETKKSIASLVSHGLSKAEEMVHAAKGYVDTKGTDLQGTIGQVSGSLASLVKSKTAPGGSAKKKSEEADPLPVSGGSSSPSPSPAVAADRGLPENQPLLSDTTQTRASWTNCCGLLDCITTSDR
ncbi:hypothetical protein LIER_02513 [Lithospermum erythrorhizon]|uniref:Uncharacterized protein n=1 Tax=Lithospermum erythrorhizon TaxID=34254 RepID=A0AAV3NSA5_LITER